MPPGEYTSPGGKSEQSPLFQAHGKDPSRRKPAQLAGWAILFLICVGLWSLVMATGSNLLALLPGWSKHAPPAAHAAAAAPSAASTPRRHNPAHHFPGPMPGAMGAMPGMPGAKPGMPGPMPGPMPGAMPGMPVLGPHPGAQMHGTPGMPTTFNTPPVRGAMGEDLIAGMHSLGPADMDRLAAGGMGGGMGGVATQHRAAVVPPGLGMLPPGMESIDPQDLEKDTTPIGEHAPHEDLGYNALVQHMGRMGVLAAPGGGLHHELHGHGNILGGALLAGMKSMGPQELDRLTKPEMPPVGVPTRQNPQLFAKNPLAEGDLENEALVWLRSDSGITEDAKGVVSWAIKPGVDKLGMRRSFAAVLTRPEEGEAPQRRYVAGIPVIEFPGQGADGNTGLHVDPEYLKIPQPFMIVAVANPAGDATIVANGATAGPHFEICHGFPEEGLTDPRVAMVASGEGEDPPDPPAQILHGKTRDTRAWHVYTAVVDGPRSELYVDGVLEASGDPGPNGLEGMSVGADPWGTFGLRGGLLELVVVPGVPSMEARFALELRLATRYQPVFAASPVPHHRTW